MVDLTPTSSFSITLQLHLPNRTGMLAKVAQAIAEEGGNLGHIELLERTLSHTVREVSVDAVSEAHAEQIVRAVKALPDVAIELVCDRTFNLHRGGKIHILSKIEILSASDLAMVYTPGVGRICKAIVQDPPSVYDLTVKGNAVGIVTDGSAVLGLGNIGPEAALPVMEGKAMLFKKFADLDAFPICLDTQDIDEIVRTVVHLSPVFGGFNLEDIAAPRCFEIEARLEDKLEMPIFHDDQHGTAIVVLAALMNAFKVVQKSLSEVRIVLNGAGAAGVAIVQLLKRAGAKQIVACDRQGIIGSHRTDLTAQKRSLAVDMSGTLADVIKGADVFIGVSTGKALSVEMVSSMAERAIVFALANPIPEIQPERVPDNVGVMATGRSDYANQINNVLAFPGVFRGALDCRATGIDAEMILAASEAIASLVSKTDLDPIHIIPSVFDDRVAPAVAAAVKQAAREAGIARC
ncbi:NAD-dependent malic enzyme [Synechococcus sp. PCC 7336]|uniref:NAD-dependent malic enzyme n=1 Tax=Synechococcus sp. PCC 7336 TaxID=195250 RepID=UPI000344B151|nr:NAD-dependent malic enzyme [Synechococcus sp. PCC 7336]